ncbi:universal stress protein [Oceanobacillus piezotolerans]|uniref:Universal stress protein n=1 Tax=Oceanobacillus piezotolerans TaxID=2448030 RepID=A0A498D413_9BACI|nr:universal stress protein [Oceanobacillus piezotolerans]RLL42942.1 universal stress protein [Oceanobacillus piezotolerans]
MANNYKSILVAVDGSKEADLAFRKSIDVAKRNQGAAITIVNVIDTRAYVAYDGFNIEKAQKEAQNLTNEYMKLAKAAGLENVDIVIEDGSPKTMITKDIATKVDADLIICGATGLNAVERFIMGSVSEAIIRSANCDVLVVRTPA